MSWRPILEGETAEAARAAIRAIGDALAALPRPVYDPAGTALFWAYAAGASDDAVTADRFDAATEGLIDAMSEGLPHLGLHGGLAGGGWVLAHTCAGLDDFLAPVDDHLYRVLRERAWRGDYDLIGGAVGFGVYFLERAANEAAASIARDAIALVVQFLDDAREDTPEGITWRTPPAWMPDFQREATPTGYFNCGLAHGVPGIVAFLGYVAELDTPPARTRALLDGATRWLWRQALEPSPRGRFDTWTAPGRAAGRARTAWCYGDPGVATALWNAARRTGASTDEAVALAREAARRAPEHTGVRDASLCHGAIGLAHLFNRHHQASGEPLFRAAAVDWFARALAMREPGSGIGGFRAWTALRAGQPVWAAIPDFLEGAAGIGLALLAATEPHEPRWDRLLLADISAGG